MSVYTIQAPDGRKIKIEAADEATAIRGAQQWATANPVAKGKGTRESPFDLSGGQSRTSIPRGAFYKDPSGNIRRNDNGDSGNPVVTPASRVKAAAGAQRDMLARDTARAGRERLSLPRAQREQDRVSALAQGYGFGLADEIMGARSAVKTGVLNMLGQPQGYTAREAYDARREAEARRLAAYTKAHPVDAALHTIFGGLTNPLNVVAGEIIGPARAVGSVRRAATVGGALGAAYGAGSAEPGSRVGGAIKGGVVGAATSGVLQGATNALAGRAAARAVAPSAPQRILSRQGVELTPGQMLGGGWQRVEDAMTSVPIAGDAIKGAQRRGIESFDQAAMSRVLAPVGGQAGGVGRAGMADTSAQVSGAYQRALSPVTVAPDQAFAADIAAVRQTPNLPPSVRQDLDAFLGDVQARLAGPIDGATWKVLDADLGAAIRSADAGSASQPGQRFLRDALIRLRGSVGGVLERADPAAYDAVRSADEASAMLARVREASQYQGTAAREGLFTAGDLNRAVRGMDTSAGNRQYAQGAALLQDLAEPGVQVLPSTVPDSGTALRSAFTSSPQGLIVGGVAGVPASIVYSRPVQAVLNQIYRATDGQQANTGLQQLAALAARNPALAPLLTELRARLTRPADAQPVAPAESAIPQSR